MNFFLLQNMQMNGYGVLLNGLALLVVNGAELREHGMLAGYNKWTWATIASQATFGLLTAAVFKYLDNITNVYKNATTMIITMVRLLATTTSCFVIVLYLQLTRSSSTCCCNTPPGGFRALPRLPPVAHVRLRLRHLLHQLVAVQRHGGVAVGDGREGDAAEPAGAATARARAAGTAWHAAQRQRRGGGGRSRRGKG